MRPALTRFAPAPTGRLHLGHVVNAIYVWGLARALGARVLLRVEDHDRQRAQPGLETALLDDLDWLEFAPDLHPTREFRAGPAVSRQSDRTAIYEAAAQQLIAAGLVYGCACSRRDIERHHALAGSGGDAPYPRTCRERRVPIAEGVTWRVRLTPEAETFDDLLHGPQRQHPDARHGDLPIRDRHGNWTYMFAVVVDDWQQGVDLVIRGNDLLDATGGQMQIARLVGRRTVPVYAHHPLVMKDAQYKLSKADGASGIVDLRTAGWTAARVIGHAAAAVGLVRSGTELAAADVPHLFVEQQHRLLQTPSGRRGS
jgi:glutamyl-tRNA synthetase/glutamyl-Q tRNA(Asp) synthetase